MNIRGNILGKLKSQLPSAGAQSGQGRAELSGAMPVGGVVRSLPVNQPKPVVRKIGGVVRAFGNRVIGTLIVLCLAGVVRAELPDVIQKTLLEHVSTVTQFKSGETKVALLDSVILVGNYKDHSIFDVQAGYSAETAPDAGEPSSGNFLIGGFFKVSTLLKDTIKFPEQWQFLNSIEHGVGYYYDTREKHGYGCYSVGLAFGLNPKP